MNINKRTGFPAKMLEGYEMEKNITSAAPVNPLLAENNLYLRGMTGKTFFVGFNLHRENRYRG